MKHLRKPLPSHVLTSVCRARTLLGGLGFSILNQDSSTGGQTPGTGNADENPASFIPTAPADLDHRWLPSPSPFPEQHPSPGNLQEQTPLISSLG